MTSLSAFDCQRRNLAENSVLLRLGGELDVFTAPLFHQEWEAVLSGGCRELFVDLGDLQFIDSAGLAALLMLYRDATATECSLVLVDELGRQERLFELTHLESILPLRKTVIVAAATS